MKRRLLRSAFVATLVVSGMAATAQPFLPDCGLYAYRAQIERVIDGDTVIATVSLGFNTRVHGERLRLAGIQTPERGTPEYHQTKSALQRMLSARAVINKKTGLKERWVYVCTTKAKRSDKEVKGRYGRYLAVIYTLKRENLNDWLINSGRAVPYAH